MPQERAMIFHEVRYPEPDDRGRTLCLQYVRYHQDDGTDHDGYRFIYRDPQDNLLSGILYIPKAAQILWLLGQAAEHGWLTTAEQVSHDPTPGENEEGENEEIVESEYRPGDFVRHPEWGLGVVQRYEGYGENQTLTIIFRNEGKKVVATKYAKLENIGPQR